MKHFFIRAIVGVSRENFEATLDLIDKNDTKTRRHEDTKGYAYEASSLCLRVLL
ncbi:MAG: hypothetical protein IKQ37_04270 [Bacteroidaceae bacterium]|nr:hypothetical protein [Bacteroidaceae bacterium]